MIQVLTAYVAVILLKDDQVLFLHRTNTGWMDGYWALPGGSLDEGESLESAIMREAHEELAIGIDKCDLKLVHVLDYQNQQKDSRCVGFYFLARRWVGEPMNNEPHKHSGLRWLPLKDLRDYSILPTSLQALVSYKQSCAYSSFGW